MKNDVLDSTYLGIQIEYYFLNPQGSEQVL